MANVIQFTIRGVDDFSKRFGKIGPALAKVGRGLAIAAGVAGTALAALTIRSLRAIDVQTKFADRLGISTEALAGMEQAAKITGVSVQNIRLGLQRMTRRVAEASQGLGEAKGALVELGLSAQDLAKLPVEEQFATISEALNGVASSSDRVRLAFKLFDSEGVALLNTAKLGAEGLKQMEQEAIALGTALTRIEAAQVEAANDAVTRAKEVFIGIGNTIATKVAPFIKVVADRLFEAARESNGFRDEISGAFEVAIRGAAFLGDAFRGLQVVFKVVQVAFAEVMNFTIQGANRIATAVLAPLNAIATSKIGEKIGLEAIQTPLEDVAIISQARIEELRGQLEEIALRPMPSDSIRAFAEEVKAAAVATAESVAAQSQSIADIGGGEEGGGLTAAMKKDIDGRLEALRNGLLTEREIIEQNFKQQQETLTLAREINKIGDEEFFELQKELLVQRNAEITALEKEAADARVGLAEAEGKAKQQAIGGALESIGTLTASENKKGFTANKAAGLAQAIISTHAGVAKALELPFPANLAAAATVLAKGLTSIGTIKGTKLAGGAQAGLESVPRTGTFLLHEGERVVQAAQNKDLTDFLREEGAKQARAGNVVIENIMIEVLPNATSADALLQMPPEDMREVVARPIIDALNFLDDAGVRPKFIERTAEA